MIDFIKEFKEYLPKWCEKKMLPMPKEGSDKWNMAWYDFMKEELNPRWEEIANSYKQMRFKTKEEAAQEKQQQAIPPVQEIEEVEEQPKSEWERVQELLKRKN